MPLAQLEVRAAAEELLAATTTIEPADDITWTSSTEPRHILIRWH